MRILHCSEYRRTYNLAIVACLLTQSAGEGDRRRVLGSLKGNSEGDEESCEKKVASEVHGEYAEVVKMVGFELCLFGRAGCAMLWCRSKRFGEIEH